MTGALVLSARLVLAAVFGLAGAAKLADRAGLRTTLSEFHVPGRFVQAGAIALPLVELLVAGLLLPVTTARWGALGALVLLSVFCAAIVRSLLRGERPDCGCAGRRRSTPIGRSTLARNAALAAIAALVVAVGPGRTVAGLAPAIGASPVAIAIAVLAALVVAQGWLAWELLRQHGRLLARVRALESEATQLLEGLPVGAEAPALELAAERLAPELPLALVFSNTGCGACETLAPELERLRHERASDLELVLVADNRDALEAYRISTVPSATIVDPDGRIASTTATGTTAVEELLASAIRPSERLRLAVR